MVPWKFLQTMIIKINPYCLLCLYFWQVPVRKNVVSVDKYPWSVDSPGPPRTESRDPWNSSTALGRPLTRWDGTSVTRSCNWDRPAGRNRFASDMVDTSTTKTTGRGSSRGTRDWVRTNVHTGNTRVHYPLGLITVVPRSRRRNRCLTDVHGTPTRRGDDLPTRP